METYQFTYLLFHLIYFLFNISQIIYQSWSVRPNSLMCKGVKPMSIRYLTKQLCQNYPSLLKYPISPKLMIRIGLPTDYSTRLPSTSRPLLRVWPLEDSKQKLSLIKHTLPFYLQKYKATSKIEPYSFMVILISSPIWQDGTKIKVLPKLSFKMEGFMEEEELMMVTAPIVQCLQ
jgi:hypothetical protein